MNNDFSQSEAKKVLTLLKEGNIAITPNLNSNRPTPMSVWPKATPASPTAKPVQPAKGLDIMGGLKNLGNNVSSGFNNAMKAITPAAPAAAPGMAPDYLGGGGSGLKAVGNAVSNALKGGGGAPPPAMGPLEKGPVPVPAQPQGSQNLSTAPITPVAPATQAVENPAMQMKQPTLQARGIEPITQAPQPAAPQFSGDVTDQERQLLRKLHASNFNPNSKRDQQMLEHLRAAGREAGGYDDFKTLRNLAYANQYGAKSDYGMLAQKWRDGRAQQVANAAGMAPKAGEYTVLTRRNTGVTTTEGNVWINPADREWLNKSAAYSDLSWEDYCGLMPSDAPESIQQFFN